MKTVLLGLVLPVVMTNPTSQVVIPREESRSPQNSASVLANPGCFELLRARNVKGDLIPEGFMPGVKVNGLKPEHCFGIRLSTGASVLGVCDPHGAVMNGKLSQQGPDGTFSKEVPFKVIGFLVLEGPLILDGQRVTEGPYAVQVFKESMHLAGNDPESKYFNGQLRRMVSRERTLKFKLATAIPEAQLEAGSKDGLRFELLLKDSTPTLALQGNQWRLQAAPAHPSPPRSPQ